MAALSQTMQTGKLVQWHVRPGDRVTKGAPLLSVETDKSVVEIEAPVEGVLLSPVALENEDYQVGDLLAWIGEAGEAPPEHEKAAFDVRGVPSKHVTPVAAKVAERYGIDPALVTGTGPGGSVTKQDIVRHFEDATKRGTCDSTNCSAATFKLTDMSLVRRRSGEKLARSWSETPQVSLVVETDFTELAHLRRMRKVEWGDNKAPFPTINDIVLKAVAVAVGSHPDLNVTVEAGVIKKHASVNLSVAVDTKDGLLVPVVRDVASMSVFEVSRITSELIRRAHAGALVPDDMVGGTFTVSNLGVFGIDMFTPLINSPQVAILGIGRIASRAMPIGDEIVIRNMASAILSFNHRFLDGSTSAKFLAKFRSVIEAPESLFR